jgi:hypothetical protein
MKILDTHFDPEVIVPLEGLDQLENAVTSSGIQPATLWLLAKFFKARVPGCRSRGPGSIHGAVRFSEK